MAKYTFRFHYHGWVDITVDGEDYDDAFEKADERYCEGDYKSDDESFENTHTELVEYQK